MSESISKLREKLSEAQKVLAKKLDTETPEWIHDRKQEVARLQQEISDKSKEMNGIPKIKHVTNELQLSDHAWARYMERIKGKDRQKIIKKLLPKKVRKMLKKVSHAELEVNGVTICVINNVITTIYIKNDDIKNGEIANV